MGTTLARFFMIAGMLAPACGGDESPGGAAPEGGAPMADASSLPSCASLCPAVLAPKCTQGPQSQDECVSGCESIRASKCADKYLALYQCGGANPVYGCDGMGRSIVIGCESASAALYTCAGS